MLNFKLESTGFILDSVIRKCETILTFLSSAIQYQLWLTTSLSRKCQVCDLIFLSAVNNMELLDPFSWC